MAKVKEAPTECPKCNGTAFFDNRADKASGKRTPKTPDWKCKAESCGEGFWLDGPKPAAKADTPARPVRPPQTWGNAYRVYQRCADIARKVWPKADAQAQVAATATLFIQANQAGLTVAEPPKPDPAPEPEPPKAKAAKPDPKLADREFADFPDGEPPEDDDEGLPW